MARFPEVSPTKAETLKLIVLDEEDLAVVSANLQDAVVRVGDMAYLPRSRRFALMLGRFDWLGSEHGRCERHHSGLHFERVLRAAISGFDQRAAETVLNLLSIGFEPGDAPGGVVLLTFSGGAAVRLDVECLEAEMHDLGDCWPARHKPGHAIDDGAAGS